MIHSLCSLWTINYGHYVGRQDIAQNKDAYVTHEKRVKLHINSYQLVEYMKDFFENQIGNKPNSIRLEHPLNLYFL